ncbi:MAG: hypothetical protein DRJ97_06155 [Thermoprotei archaeon]|nr:MAG: hypothetical protein DRJ97_06155 [Thermoprotei archaeon]
MTKAITWGLGTIRSKVERVLREMTGRLIIYDLTLTSVKSDDEKLVVKGTYKDPTAPGREAKFTIEFDELTLDLISCNIE